MAAPTYATDLATISDAQSNTGGTWGEPPSAGQGALSAIPETDYFIQGTGCVSKSIGNVAAPPQLSGIAFAATAPVTFTGSNAVFVWMWFGAPNGISALANGGMRVIVGQDSGNFRHWYVLGADTYALGGWQCIPVDPTQTALSELSTGAPSTTRQYFGVVASVMVSISKGAPFAVDAIRHGRALNITNGDLANGYATFAGASAISDSTANRWGLCSAIEGGYKIQGLFSMGLAGTAVDFRDANRSIVVANTTKVAADFNSFEVNNAASRVDWTGITISALGTQSRGRFVANANATINLVDCTFNDMNIFTFQSNTVVTGTTFRRCGLITQGSSVITGCRFEGTIDTVKALLSNNPGNVQNTAFVAGSTVRHGMEISATGTYSFIGNTWTGFGADGTTTAAIYNNSGGAVTLNISGGTVPTVRNGAGASTTVVASVTVTFTGLRNPTEVRVYTRDGSGASATEVAGNDSVTSGSFSFSSTAGTHLNVIIFALGYQPVNLIDFVVPTADSSIPITQVLDRQYAT